MPMLRQSSPYLLLQGLVVTLLQLLLRTENSVSHLSYPSLLPLTENAVLGRIPFSYLEDIQMRFMKNYGKVASYAPAYSMNDEFSRVLHQQMGFFSSK
ncbi:hypothetical protein MTR67_002010 [Solanum verrucosum]|uniref:Longin domain-containing protein n=1 Tax=Solanum verrucosum TaxID=315347 RepID=A0AAF0PSW5_SOLVR|nr:hypothetical protein MTR67_002010 [Solanum verrucosum]